MGIRPPIFKGQNFYVMDRFTKEELFKLHVTDGMKIDDIAAIYGVSHATISRYFKKYNIPSKHAKGNDFEKCVGEYVPELDNYDFLYKEYVTEGKSISDIAKQYGKPYSYVREKLKNAKIPRREANKTRWGKEKRKSDAVEIQYDELYDLFINKRKTKEEIASVYGLSAKEIGRRLSLMKIYKTLRFKIDFFEKLPEELRDKNSLNNLYHERKMSCKDIADMFSVSEFYVKKAMKLNGISLRTQAESAKLLRGDKSPRWKGVNYSLYDKLRAYSRDNLHKLAKERDGYTCQCCGAKINLQVHHKNPLWRIYYEILSEHPEYNQYDNIEELREILVNDERVNDLSNLVTYCEDCHLFKVHGYTKNEVAALKDRRRVKYFN